MLKTYSVQMLKEKKIEMCKVSLQHWEYYFKWKTQICVPFLSCFLLQTNLHSVLQS